MMLVRIPLNIHKSGGDEKRHPKEIRLAVRKTTVNIVTFTDADYSICT
jgi:hypothetical protein